MIPMQSGMIAGEVTTATAVATAKAAEITKQHNAVIIKSCVKNVHHLSVFLNWRNGGMKKRICWAKEISY